MVNWSSFQEFDPDPSVMHWLKSANRHMEDRKTCFCKESTKVYYFQMLLILWTLFVIMASVESAENNIGLVEGVEGMNAKICEVYIELDFLSDNRYNGLQCGENF